MEPPKGYRARQALSCLAQALAPDEGGSPVSVDAHGLALTVHRTVDWACRSHALCMCRTSGRLLPQVALEGGYPNPLDPPPGCPFHSPLRRSDADLRQNPTGNNRWRRPGRVSRLREL